MQNGHSPAYHESVADIKTAAREQVLRVRGASATSLLRSAGEQIQLGKSSERDGDLRGALSAYTKAVSLTTMFMDTTEFKQELLSFPSARYDDQVDALSQLLAWVQTRYEAPPIGGSFLITLDDAVGDHAYSAFDLDPW